MAGIASVAGVGLEGSRIQMEYLTRIVGMQRDMIDELGAQALRLIESATIDSAVGGNIDISI